MSSPESGSSSEPRRLPLRRVAAAVLALALLAGAIWTLRQATRTSALVASALGRLTGSTVEIDSTRIEVGAEFRVQLVGLRVFPRRTPAQVGPLEPLLRVDRVRASTSWARLLSGRLTPGRVQLERPVLVVEGAFQARRGSPRWSLPPANLSVLDGMLVWRPPGEAPLQISGLRIDAAKRVLGPGVEGSAAGVLARAGASVGSFAVEFRGWLDQGRVQGRVTGVDLAALPRGPLTLLKGQASGSFSVFVADGKTSATTSLEIAQLEAQLPGMHGAIVPAHAALALDLRWTPGQLQLRPNPLTLDDFRLRGDLSIDTRPRGHLRGWLALDPFSLGGPPERLQLLRIGGLRFASWKDVDRRAEAGRIEGVRLELHLPRDQVAATLAFEGRVDPQRLRLTAHVRDAVYRPNPESPPLEGIRGDITIEGDVLQVTDLEMSRAGRPLPRVDVRIDGMRRLVRLPRAERATPRGPGVPIPGLGPAFASLHSTGEHPPARVFLRDFAIGYPAFVLPYRDVEAELSFPDGNLSLDRSSGVLGGAPAEVTALWDVAANTVEARVRYLDADASPPRPLGARWARGSIQVPTLWLGDWRVDDLEGAIEATGARVVGRGLRARLHGGATRAEGELSLALEGEAPYSLNLAVKAADAAVTSQVLGLEPGRLTGTGSARGTLSGKLVPSREFLEDAHVELDVEVHDGIYAGSPLTVTLARLASPLGWRGLFGEPLPYRRARAHVSIDRGLLKLADFELESSELRAVAAGSVDLLSPEYETHMLVALMFLETLDRVIHRVPVLGHWVLGKDRSLVAAYFRLQGPWDDLSGSYVPPQTIRTATGWASRLIRGGVRGILDVLSRSAPGGKDRSGEPGSKQGS
ncbi:MAG: AsmA-like C-terminal domain-containing protein [Myxococcota bacterium]